MSLLVVVATPEEAKHLPATLRLVVTGIGKTAAAMVATQAILEERPTHVLNVGSAGALRDGLTGLFEIGTVLNHDMNGDALRSLGFDPRDVLTLGDAETVLATGDVFVTDAALRDRLAVDAHLVDMEGYAVAYVAQAFGVPVTLLKHVSDNADETAWDWLDSVAHSARALGEWVSDRHG